MRNLLAWLDNPLLIKHIRTRLRRPMLVQSIVVLGAVTGMAVFWDIAAGTFPSEWLGYSNWIVQGVLLGLMGTNQVVSSVGSARESGILDFHRISPEEPRSVTLGFFLGAPIREDVLFVLTLPVTLLVMAAWVQPMKNVPLVDWFQGLIAVLLLSWLLQAVGMLSALTSAKASKSWTGIQVVVVIAGLYLFGLVIPFLSRGFRGMDPAYEAWDIQYFGFEVPWALGLALFTVPLTFFALIASVRKFRSERIPALSKLESLGFVTTAAVSLLGYFWGYRDTFIPFVYLLVLAGLIGSLSISPRAGEYGRGVRRAGRQGRRHLPFWDDLALGRVILGLICTVILIAGTVGRAFLRNTISGVGGLGASTLSVPIAVLTVAVFGLGFQYFRLRSPGRAGSLMAMSIFLLWVVPGILWGIVEATGLGSSYPMLPPILAGISPWTGLAAISAMPSEEGRSYAQIAALIPALGLPFLLNTLITSQHRRIDKEMRAAVDQKSEKNPLD